MNVFYFSAAWCGPCKMMKPAYEKFVEKMGDRINSVIIDVDTDKDLVSKYNVRSVPSIVFEAGSEVKTLVGVQSITKLEEIVTEYESRN